MLENSFEQLAWYQGIENKLLELHGYQANFMAKQKWNLS